MTELLTVRISPPAPECNSLFRWKFLLQSGIAKGRDVISGEEYVEFRHWFLERDWEDWDRQIRVESDVDKLEFLVRESEEDRALHTVDDL